MKIRNILYISAIILLAGCSKDADISNSTLSGNGEKTPLRINATLNTDRAGTRAAGNTFAVNDQLKVYIRHTTEGSKGSYSTVSAGQAPSLVSINVTSAGTSPSLSPIYWDDFSNSTDASTDLRTSGHGLQSYYSYCYNGGTPTTALNKSTSILGWTVSTAQDTDTNLQKSDLLWSPEQETVTYSHSTAYNTGHGDFPIPYKHAMSEVTVTVTAAAGFDGSTNPLSNTQLILNAMNTVTELNALSQSFSPLKQETAGNINSVTMRAESYTAGTLTRDYTAIVAPGTILKEDVKLLDITNAHGNNYTVTITAAMLSSANSTDWGNGLSGDNQIGIDGGGKHYIVTQPGVNYHLDVTIKKSSVQTHATLADWTTVTAESEGDITLNDDDTNLYMDDSQVPEGQRDVAIVGVDKNNFSNGASFSLFRVNTKHNATDSNTKNDDITPLSSSTRPNDTSGNYPGYEFATISTFTNDATEADDDKWTNAPIIYWPNITQKYYFRALAKYHDNVSGLNISSVGSITPLDKGTAVSQGTISDGVATGDDILWGTTPQHKGYSNTVYKRGWAIPPRKGGVPIAFEHALSKISITLETTDDAEVLETNAKVNLTDATIAISNIYTNATITIDNGDMDFTGKSKVENAISATATTFENLNLLVIPQTFGDNALVTITLPNENNAVYTIPLKDCIDTSTTSTIPAWVRGKNYSYTIHIEKEAVQFHALVKDWDVVNGSGTATLDW